MPLLGLMVVVTFVYAVVGAFLYSERFGFAVDKRAVADAKSWEGGRPTLHPRRADFYSTAKGANAAWNRPPCEAVLKHVEKGSSFRLVRLSFEDPEA